MPDPVLSLLVGEDDDVAAEAIVRGIRKRGLDWQVLVVEDGAEALEVLRGNRPERTLRKPFALVVDLNMPRMNGFELIETLRRDPELRRTVVFVLTTSNSQSDRKRAYELGVAGYLVKSGAEPQHSNVVGLLHSYREAVLFPD